MHKASFPKGTSFASPHTRESASGAFKRAQDYERSGDTSAPPHKNTQSATIAKMPTTSVTISPTEILVVVMRVRLPPA